LLSPNRTEMAMAAPLVLEVVPEDYFEPVRFAKWLDKAKKQGVCNLCLTCGQARSLDESTCPKCPELSVIHSEPEFFDYETNKPKRENVYGLEPLPSWQNHLKSKKTRAPRKTNP